MVVVGYVGVWGGLCVLIVVVFVGLCAERGSGHGGVVV